MKPWGHARKFVVNSRRRGIYLVTVAPEEVLRPDVLICVLIALLNWRLVRLVLPVLDPETPCVDASDDDGRDHDTVSERQPVLLSHLLTTGWGCQCVARSHIEGGRPY